MPSQVWETTWSWLLKDGAGLLILDPYGGEMVRVVPAVTPFPHRQALYNIQYYGFWSKSGRQRRRSTWAGSEGSTGEAGWRGTTVGGGSVTATTNPRWGIGGNRDDDGCEGIRRWWLKERGGISGRGGRSRAMWNVERTVGRLTRKPDTGLGGGDDLALDFAYAI
ncbi:hypothetical protein OsJ_25970 [Oryza sativa Japonica Group]|uniref:Uncharacterized protein n=1 Tax=Oryza sativa subsp. japonica TaxID=39947 RepID=B9FYZ2_ORYSJ|nr:hypothetical protein OsJ_25970 [Oryza sativa Japonica Group]